MARARNIKPGFYQNDELASCSLMARFIFPGLWMLADREGRLEDRPLKIKASLLPYEAANIDKLLTELHERGFVMRYSVGGRKYVQINNFQKHQNPHCKEPASTIPAPQGCHSNECPAPGENGTLPVVAPDDTGRQTDTTRLIPSSLIPDSGLPASGASPGDRFDEFWSVWPKKVAKSDALRAWKKLKPTDETVSRIIADVVARSRSPKWAENNGEFIPHPATYLNGHRWEDEGVKLPTGPPPEPDWVAERKAQTEREYAEEQARGTP